MLLKHKLKQTDPANLLRVSQSAVSLYGRKIRGKAINLESETDVVATINGVANRLVEGEMDYTDFMIELCKACRLIRKKGIMCNLHKTFDPSIDVEKCKLCSFIS